MLFAILCLACIARSREEESIEALSHDDRRSSQLPPDTKTTSLSKHGVGAARPFSAMLGHACSVSQHASIMFCSLLSSVQRTAVESADTFHMRGLACLLRTCGRLRARAIYCFGSGIAPALTTVAAP